MKWFRSFSLILFSGFSLLPMTMIQAELVLVEEGQARGLVVVAAKPTPTVEYAVEELLYHVKRATGTNLPVARENSIPTGYATRIYIGDTAAARQAGIAIDQLGPDVFVLKTMGQKLFIAGRENPQADPLDPGAGLAPNPYGGPLFGVYELLERKLGISWLWPGELGTHVPATNRFAIGRLNETTGPKLRYRNYRLGSLVTAPARYRRANPLLRRMATYSEADFERYSHDLRVYNRRHRMGYSVPRLGSGHSASGTNWRTYGETHPEWFAMDEDGKRVGGTMCLTNPELAEYIINERWDGGPWLRLGEADQLIYCQCPDCVAADAPQPASPSNPLSWREWTLDNHYIISDRYAKFWKKSYEMAVERNPDLTMAVLLYYHYFPAPLQEIELNQNIHGSFVPWGVPSETVWFPLLPENLEWLKEQWLGWASTGISIAYRPNDTLGGYTMPALNTWQRGDFIRFAYRHGMMGMDVDSLIGQWAVRGPEHYLYFRLMADPGRTVGQIRREYFAAFGPAAGLVERYFDYWEDYQYQLVEEDNWGPSDRYALRIDGRISQQYPPEIFPPAAALLAAAMKAAQQADSPEYRERIEFLQAGLEHARLCARFIGLIHGGRAASDPILPEDQTAHGFILAQEGLSDLLAFRKEHQHLHISDFANPRVAGREIRFAAELESLLTVIDQD